jgi:hypothetical protein
MADTIDNKRREQSRPDVAPSVRPVIEHALTIYYDGNAELARALIDQLLDEGGTP